MAIVTNDGHTSRAKDWYNKCQDGDVWFCIGGLTPWTDEPTPDPETEDETIEDVVAYKKVEQWLYVIEDEAGSIYYHGSNYRIVSEDQIYAEHCRWVLINAFFNYDEIPVYDDSGVEITYRKIGVATNLKPIAGAEDKYILLPAEVQDKGHIDVVANDTPTTRSPNKREKVQLLVEF